MGKLSVKSETFPQDRVKPFAPPPLLQAENLLCTPFQYGLRIDKGSRHMISCALRLSMNMN